MFLINFPQNTIYCGKRIMKNFQHDSLYEDSGNNGYKLYKKWLDATYLNNLLPQTRINNVITSLTERAIQFRSRY